MVADALVQPRQKRAATGEHAGGVVEVGGQLLGGVVHHRGHHAQNLRNYAFAGARYHFRFHLENFRQAGLQIQPGHAHAHARAAVRRGHGLFDILGGLGADQIAPLRAQHARQAFVNAQNAIGQIGIGRHQAARKQRGRDLARAHIHQQRGFRGQYIQPCAHGHGRVRAQKRRLYRPGVQGGLQKRVLLHGAGKGRAGYQRAQALGAAPVAGKRIEPLEHAPGMLAVS